MQRALQQLISIDLFWRQFLVWGQEGLQVGEPWPGSGGGSPDAGPAWQRRAGLWRTGLALCVCPPDT